MNAALLLEHYARIADAPDAIARLRRFVLALAVRGKLVEPDAADEPAAELLKRIAAENLEASVRGLGKALRTKREDLPFAPPKHWEWAKLVAFSEASYGFAFASNRFNSDKVGMPLIRIRDISGTDTEAYFDGEYDPWYVVKNGDYLVGMDGDFNLRRWRGGDALLNQRVLRLNDWRCGIEPEFVRLPLQMTLDHVHGRTSQTTVKHLSAKQVNGIEIPLPPLAEQHRIVAKVDELMALCDQLETVRAEREAARDTFTQSTLAKLNTPDPETFGQDARFALANLVPLTTRPDQIKQLRQTILRLALSGKLTDQDQADEPASKLLATIEARRSALLRAGYPNPTEARTQQRKVAEQSLPSTLPELPLGWQFATLQQCALMVIDCKNKTAPYTQSGVRLIRTTNVRDGKLNAIDQRYVSPETYEVWSARAKPEPGDILITREAPMGEVCLIPTDTTICLGQRMMLARLVPDTINSRFMLYSLMDPDLMDRVQDKPIGMTVQHLRVGGVETLIVPLPPLAEQRRIVAKVDALMTLCDQLETCLDDSEKVRSKLLEAVLHCSLSTDTEQTGLPEKSAGESNLEAV